MSRAKVWRKRGTLRGIIWRRARGWAKKTLARKLKPQVCEAIR